jgi:hypothetical protein
MLPLAVHEEGAELRLERPEILHPGEPIPITLEECLSHQAYVNVKSVPAVTSSNGTMVMGT